MPSEKENPVRIYRRDGKVLRDLPHAPNAPGAAIGFDDDGRWFLSPDDHSRLFAGFLLPRLDQWIYLASDELRIFGPDGTPPRAKGAALERAIRAAVDAAQASARALAPITMAVERYEERDHLLLSAPSFIHHVVPSLSRFGLLGRISPQLDNWTEYN